MIYRNFKIQLGLDVDDVPAGLKVGHVTGFSSFEEALDHLRHTVVRCLTDRPVPACCETWYKDVRFTYCPECGFRLVDGFPSGDEVRDYFTRLIVEPMSALHDAGVVQHFRNAGWSLTGFVSQDPPCQVRGFGRWLARCGPDDRPYVEGQYPDGEEWDSWFTPC